MVNAFLWIDALAMPFDQTIDEIARALRIRESRIRVPG